MGDVLNFGPVTSNQLDEPKPEAQQMANYPSQFVGDVLDYYANLGLDDTYLGIFGRHLNDLKLVVAHGQGQSRLNVHKSETEMGPVWDRRVEIFTDDIQTYAERLRSGFAANNISRIIERNANGKTGEVISLETGKPTDYKVSTKAVSKELALDWLFFELTADALANSYSMQQRYDRYIPDYNGQCVYDEAELAIASRFFEAYAQEETANEQEPHIRHERLAFRSGVALELLKEAILRKGLLEREKQAAWLTNFVAINYPRHRGDSPIVPLNHDELIQRVGLLVPKQGVSRGYVSLALEVEASYDEE